MRLRSAVVRGALAVVVAMGLIGSADHSADATFDESGQWSDLHTWPLIPLHMALTPDGHVMSFGTDGAGVQGGSTIFDVWIPALGSGAAAHSVTPNGIQDSDLLCAIQVIDPLRDVILTAGGDVPGAYPQAGSAMVTSYSTETGYQEESPMEYARWYASGNTLPDGRILVEAGSIDGVGNYVPGETGTGVLVPEVYTSGVGWTTLTGINSEYAYGSPLKDGSPENRWWYPRSWVAPDGRMFGIAGSAMYYLDTSGVGSLSEAGTFPGGNIGATSTAVMYRPGKILQAGGGAFDNSTIQQDGSKVATIIDINSGQPVLTQATPLSYGRHWSTSTVLPDGDVLVTGGSQVNNTLTGLANQPEIWDPDTDTWTVLAAEQNARLYHSAAILLPDATVLVAGGGAPGPQTNLNGQILTPPYLFDGDGLAVRPTITAAPEQVRYNERFDIQVSADVQKITFVRASAVTHSFNSGQRFMELEVTGTGSTRTVTAPADGNVAPPGTYLMFAIDSDGTPSVAALVDIDPGEPDPDPEPEPDPVDSRDDSAFVTDAFQDVLGRSGNVSETAAALTTVSTSGRAQMLEDLFLDSSDEGQSRAAIARLYRAFFLREPDLGGFNYWYGQSVGLDYDPNPISYSFSVQTEFSNLYGDVSNSEFIDLVYANLFNRAPDPQGKTYWLGLLDSGQLNRGQVMIWFSEGLENKHNVDGRILVVNTYRALLGRMPTDQELLTWQHQLNPLSGTPPGDPRRLDELLDEIIESQEYIARFTN